MIENFQSKSVAVRYDTSVGRIHAHSTSRIEVAATLRG
jgi:hypothetical protein